MTPETHPRPDQATLELAQMHAVVTCRALVDTGAVTLDTETGLADSRVWQLALVDGRTLTPLLSLVCHPGEVEWTERAAEMRDAQGLRPETFPAATVFGPVVAAAAAWQPAIWNAGFDVGAIGRTWPGRGDWSRAVCIQDLYAPLTGEWSARRGAWKSGSLEEACVREGVDLRALASAHTAYGDACRLALLIRAVAARETDTERRVREDEGRRLPRSEA